jgi:glycosyltransferase involved in cell wall biosynthesis
LIRLETAPPSLFHRTGTPAGVGYHDPGENGHVIKSSGDRELRVLFFVEGFTDIRFVTGLAEISDLSIAVPARQYVESGLKERVADSGCQIAVHEIPGGRLGFQTRSLSYLWRHARDFDVILAQEVLRGALNANVIGKLRKVPVVTYMGIAPVEYYRCRYEIGQIGVLKATAGELAIRCLMAVNGRLSSCCLAMGPYLRDVAARHCSRSRVGLYYGVDTDLFRPSNAAERSELRRRLGLPADKFIVLFSSRMSHEKDPETVLKAVSIARSRGLNAIVLNIGGGYREFIGRAHRMDLGTADEWVLGRPAAHPMKDVPDFYRAVDLLAQASLAEGAAYSTLEALACGIPVVATAVGGMRVQLDGYARLVPRRDAAAMADQFLWVAENGGEATSQAFGGRNYVIREWSREKAFGDLLRVLQGVTRRRLEENAQ